MRSLKKIFYILIMLCFACGLTVSPKMYAQNEPIKVKFEIDGKEVQQPFRILLSGKDSAIFEPRITNDSFIFPQELRSYEKVNLRLLYKKYELDYGEIYLTKFSCDMTFGIDNKPFDEENIPSEPLPDKELKLIYYINFCTTRLQICEYK